ncbi:hypothetical protein CSB07_00015 [Candidatus Gracilibacteria bacterium]|nr:MAG: hypothetical protein CSB07_00015 [Candidatus Gracilibacteria bacterium]PIE85661.1 MAG: hypothetical protein CSA08_00760 [Candidatus Gracilibacteria bacterium]
MDKIRQPESYKTPKHIANTILSSQEESIYIYDIERMREQMKKLDCLPEQVSTFYAMKVNPHPNVVAEALKNSNIEGIEVASQGEIDVVLNSGEYDLARVIYTGPGKKEDELNFSIKNGIKYLNVESMLEAVRIDKKAEKFGIIQPILLRLNTKHKFKEGETGVKLGSADTQFGLAQGETIKNLKILSKLKNIRVDGFHMYPASQIMDADVILRSVNETFKFITDIEETTGLKFKVVDFGGGFGIDYGGFREFDIEKYANGLKELINKYNFTDKKLILELGRYLGADMGYFATKINDIKKIGKENKGIICYAGTNALKRPQVLNVDYHVDIVKAKDSTNREIYNILESIGADKPIINPEDTVNVYGPFCTSVDYLAKGRTGLEAEIGDYVVMPQSGAYGRTMSPQEFLSHPKVPEIIIK